MRWPTRDGLVIPPQELGFHAPTPEQLQARRATTVHHLYWERHRYDIRHRAVFRSLIDHTLPMLAQDHTLLHEQFDAPRRPRDSLMVEVLDDYLTTHGVIRCVKEKRTKEIYQIQPEEWVSIKKGYKNVGAK